MREKEGTKRGGRKGGSGENAREKNGTTGERGKEMIGQGEGRENER